MEESPSVHNSFKANCYDVMVQHSFLNIVPSRKKHLVHQLFYLLYTFLIAKESKNIIVILELCSILFRKLGWEKAIKLSKCNCFSYLIYSGSFSFTFHGVGVKSKETYQGNWWLQSEDGGALSLGGSLATALKWIWVNNTIWYSTSEILEAQY